MKRLKLRGRELNKIGYTNDKAISVAINIIQSRFRGNEKMQAIQVLKDIFENKEKYRKHNIYSPIVEALYPPMQASEKIIVKNQTLSISLRSHHQDYTSYGVNEVEYSAINQMEMAMKLPITVKGALMADAHEGYGLPIGGVLATRNAVIPYGVGMDIGCRMCLSVFDIPPSYINGSKASLKNMLEECTSFGKNATVSGPKDHEVMDRKIFFEIPILKEYKSTAYKQLGSSGSGNHFVDIGIVELTDGNSFHIPAGSYLGILSHSGSRRLGAAIATHYTQIAKRLCALPKGAINLAWIDLDTQEGIEYWEAMSLAGDYSKACHEIIHAKIAKYLGEKPLFKVENHHNFAWKEKLDDGTDVIVHRKGATPAQKGVLGVIPGSMTTPAYIVKGMGNPDSIYSASHGAGRKMSRSRAKQSFSQKELNQVLQSAGVTLIGGGTDEAPMAYKDITRVMKYQRDLVETEGIFYPKIVKMSGD
ncbi:MAG: RtcB family protein [Bacteroidales bacterium]|nr:RtcB family protein [Bacteroidales bacterium]